MKAIKIKSILEGFSIREDSYPLLYQTLNEQENWFKMIRKDVAYESIINEIKVESERLLNEPIEEISYVLFKLFEETGSRIEFERVYFEKRRRLNTFAIMSLLEPGNRIYQEELHQIIWSICNEYSWCLPAHLKDSPELSVVNDFSLVRQPKQYTIDLFAAETAFSLSEILQLTKDYLDPFLRKRIIEEIYERIFLPYQNHPPFPWETATHNWASVCAGSIGSAALYLIDNDDELALILEKVLKTMDCYLDGFNDDGTCLEGYGYWEYGFGFYVYFADLFKKRTEGKIDLFSNEKVHKIALFQQKSFLYKNIVVNFSDAQATSSVFLGLSHYLSNIYPDFEIPEVELRAIYTEDHTSRWAPAFRNLYWFDREKVGKPWSENSYYLKESQWLVSRYQSENMNYGFAAKGGHNDEPHNHNDLGHFILQKNGEVYLKDIGSGLYTDDYFGKERYTFLCNGSHGHSVPIINEQFQKEGRSNQASIYHVNLDGERVNLLINMAAAYSIESLQGLTREFTWKKTTEPTLILTDHYTFTESPTSIIERLIIPDYLVMEDEQGIIIQGEGRLQVVFNRNQLSLEVETLEFMNHFGQLEKVKALDFIVRNPKKDCKIQLIFQFK